MKKVCFYNTTLGRIGIAERNGAITNLFVGSSVVPSEFEEQETPLLKRAADQIQDYLDGKRTEFDLPLLPDGTAFQRSVWGALCTIPYGTTRSYGEIATQIGNPKASRAVGRANGANPIIMLIPCHRVIGADGSMTGFSAGMDLKIKLLRIEKR